MQIRLRLFAAFREVVGKTNLELDLPPGSTVGDLFTALERNYSAISPLRPCTTFAVNREVVSADAPLRGGDEVAFLQPVSGGDRD